MESNATSAMYLAVDEATLRASTESFAVAATLDLRGPWYLLPPLRVLGALEALRPGDVFELLGTNPAASRIVSWLAQRMGEQLLGIVEDGRGLRRTYLRKS